MMFLGLLLAAAPQGQVHVVDAAGAPGSDFTTLSAAVAAASEGDVVLVRPGDYFDDGSGFDGIFLTDKGLTVVADSGAVRTDRISVFDLPSTGEVLVQGIEFLATNVGANLRNNAGPLWFEGCSFEPQFTFIALGFHPTDCATVVVTRSQFYSSPIFTPATALLSRNSRLHLFESNVQGISGGLSAIELEQGSFLALYGSAVQGGVGAPGNFFTCDGEVGGDALTLQDASSLVTLGSQLTGGDGGTPFSGSCNAGPPGQPLIVVDGTVTPLAGSARSLDVVSPVRTDEMVQATLTGLPGDRVWFRYSLAAGPGEASRFYDGEYLLAAPRIKAFSATIPASGQLVVTAPAPAPALAPGQESLIIHCQAFFRDPTGQRFVLSSPDAVVLLDASF